MLVIDSCYIIVYIYIYRERERQRERERERWACLRSGVITPWYWRSVFHAESNILHNYYYYCYYYYYYHHHHHQ